MEKSEHHHNNKLTAGQKAADKIASVIGSWKFIVTETVILLLWVAFNIVGWIENWDPYPFVFLNLLVGLQAAYAAPIILMSQDRTEERDRRKSEMDLATDRKSEREIEEIKRQLNRIENDKIKKILDILEKK